MKIALAVLTILPLILSAQVRVVAPDWTNLNAPYIEDPVPVQVAINGSGHAAVVNAPDPLPDNVVTSIERSCFNERQYLGENWQPPKRRLALRRRKWNGLAWVMSSLRATPRQLIMRL
jgi:hypothetical protein